MNIWGMPKALGGWTTNTLKFFSKNCFFEVGQLQTAIFAIFQKKKTLKINKKKWYSPKWGQNNWKKWDFFRKSEVGNFKIFLGIDFTIKLLQKNFEAANFIFSKFCFSFGVHHPFVLIFSVFFLKNRKKSQFCYIYVPI